MTRWLAAALTLGVLCPTIPARAHFTEPVPPGWAEWAARQWSIRGGHCCLESHAYLYPDEYTINPDGSVTITLQGMHVTLPPDKFVRRIPGDINPTGQAVVWYDGVDPTGTLVYCFDGPGALG